MKSAISLLVLLLFSMCGAQTRSTQTEVQPERQDTGAATAVYLESQSTGAAAAAAEVYIQLDVSAELKELRDMVSELSVSLKFTNEDLDVTVTKVAALEKENARLLAKVGALETENADQKTELTVVKERLVTSETKVAALERVNEAQDKRLSAGETTVEELKMDNTAQTAELTAVKTRLVDTEAELPAVKTRLADTEAEVETLRRTITGAPKVAFSAGLTKTSQYITAVSGDMNLVFRNIITNVGRGYNSQTGVFTAPVKGVYYFRYTVSDAYRSGWLNIRTLVNGRRVMVSAAYDDNGQRIHGSNGLTLQLEEGDTVNLQLHSGDRVYDDDRHLTNFSGFLLFPLQSI